MNRLTYMYILDSILKNVQGQFVRLIETRLPNAFQMAFQLAPNDDERKALIKLFYVWHLLLSQRILGHISVMLNLPQHVRHPLIS